MRTALILLALAVNDVARALGGEFPTQAIPILAAILFVAIVMDIVDFIRGNR